MNAHHLFRCHTNSLDGELATAHVKKIFQVRAKEVNDQDIVKTLLTKMMNLWNTSCGFSNE